MKLTRLDLDGAGSPMALVTRILALEPDLPIPVPIEALCAALDITAIQALKTEGFEAALLTDAVKSQGLILVADGRQPRRRRFSIAHELGHFLIPTHRGGPVGFHCTARDFRLSGKNEADRRVRMEIEANRFAGLMLIPPPRLQSELRQLARPDVADVVRLADLFAVSKEAMARAYVKYSREAVAFVIIRNGMVLRHYRNERLFPWIEPQPQRSVPRDSIAANITLRPRESGRAIECDPTIWIGDRDLRRVEHLTEQVLVQDKGFALVMLHAQLQDEDEEDDDERHAWRPQF